MTEELRKAIAELEDLDKRLGRVIQVQENNTRRVNAAVESRMAGREYYDAAHYHAERERLEAEVRRTMDYDLDDPYRALWRD